MSNRPINPLVLREIVTQDMRIELDDLLSTRRGAKIPFARAVITVALHDIGEYSFPEIARGIGGRSHSTLIEAANRLRKGDYDTDARTLFEEAIDAMDYTRWVYNRALEMSQIDRGAA